MTTMTKPRRIRKPRKGVSDQAVEAQIQLTIDERERRLAAVAEIDAELREWVQQGFANGISGPRLAEVAGVSVPRIYQIRDGRRR